MKFILAPDKYKGSLTGREFCVIVARGIQKVIPNAEIVSRPLADGGDGTIDVVKDYLNASVVSTKVKDPFFREITVPYLLSADQQTAFIEMSEASGYKLLHKWEMNCMHTTTFGTGEMIVDALEKGAKHIVLGIGGSATNDGGMGMAAALGFEFLDKEGQVLEPVGKHLSQVFTINADQVHPKLKEVKIEVACDVTNPFYGNQGAAHVYGPQKGASVEEVAILDQGLKHFARVLHSTFNIDVQQIQGAGAAGGLGGGAVVFLNAELVSGVDLVMEMAQFEQVLKGADWVITGEGQLDGQTLSGKTINGVIKAANQNQVPVAAFCGSVDVNLDQMESLGLDYAVSILNQIGNLDDAKANTVQNLELAAYNFARLLKRSML
ncbi:glycerate kinase [Allomuricauda sp. NBRC 101325]|uniref:glycerate kinase n=1 Tax=Allomuricauda sp. NBRC 101325 TaxID=1113758 RepID=UPI0024A4EE82|nr:glycerate kinase [Muricauda sp. NBRC 101325]GLU42945.1 glycerate kinase [Muricauda sp. NBRC 101325]